MSVVAMRHRTVARKREVEVDVQIAPRKGVKALATVRGRPRNGALLGANGIRWTFR